MRSPDTNLSTVSPVMSGSQPLVSVIIPTYNRAELVARAINSVIAQTYQNWEILLIDDNSQEDIAAVVKRINSDRLSYYRHAANQGGSAARNTGIRHAQGKYLAFLDSDDVWLPDKLKLQLEAILLHKTNLANLDLDNVVCYTKFRVMLPAFGYPAVLPARGKTAEETVADYFWLGGGEMLTSSMMVSRSLAMANQFQPRLPRHQDLDFVLGLDRQGAEFIFVDRILTNWHNEPRGDRISDIPDYQPSLDWIEHYRDKISPRAFNGFVFKEVMPKMFAHPSTKPQAMRLLITGWRDGMISFPRLVIFLSRQIVPVPVQQMLKKILRKLAD